MDEEQLPTIERLDELEEFVQRHPDLHVRVSRGPAHDEGRTSRDYESGLELPGLSVEPLTPESWWDRPLADWLARRLCAYAHLREQADDDRRVWILTGRHVGRGPDNEPLLADVVPIAWVSAGCVAQAERRYHERFAVGKDST